MNLILDIGNSRTKLGIFQGGKLLRREVWSELTVAALQALAYNRKIENAIYSSTANVPTAVAAFLKDQFSCLELTHETPLPIRLAYRTPQTLGKDRIAGAVGAFHHFPGKNCLVIDAGTCITYDVLDASGSFLGGNIAPGVEMRLRAMHEFTAKLPLVSPAPVVVSPNSSLASEALAKLEFGDTETLPFLGTNTENALRFGAVLGAAFELEGYVRLAKKRLKHLKVILTGGDAELFGSALKTKIFARPNLVLEGLNQILNYNVERTKNEF